MNALGRQRLRIRAAGCGVVGLTLLFAAQLASSQPIYRPLSGSEVLWDRYGVPHVYARSTQDLFFGFGWAQARSHGEILAKLYAQARGRAAEYYGVSELDNDRWMAVNDVPARARTWLARQSPDFRCALEAFAAGINAAVRAHPEGLSADAQRVFPVTASDVVAHGQRLFQFIYAAPESVTRHIPEPAPPETTEPAGSNGWALGPGRTRTHGAMLLMNPHLPWTAGWSTYYEAQLTAPGIDLYGATQIGLPVLRFMFSDYLAFTHTVNSPTAVTFYRIAEVPGGYRFDGRTLVYQTRYRILRYRNAHNGQGQERLRIRSTIQGPIVGEQDGAPVAMRVAGLDRPRALDEYWHMATAHDFTAFQAAVSELQVPTFNILYADRDGHIEYLYNGLVPRHEEGDTVYWAKTVPGDTSRTLWNDYLGFDELPKVIDPPGGMVQNANEPPWNAAWPQTLDPAPYRSEIPAARVNLRAARALRMLSATPEFSFDQLEVDRWSTRSELADRILPDLLAAAHASDDALTEEAAGVLERWDRCTDAHSRGALLFLAWTDETGGLSGYRAEGFAHPFVLDQPLDTPRGLADPHRAVEALARAARSMMARYGALDTEWGQVMRLRIGDVDRAASGGPGRLGVFNVIDYGPETNGTRTANFGSSFTALVSFEGTVRAKVLLTYGQSSQPGSPHASDQLELLSAGRLRDVWRTRAEVEENLESRDRF